MTRFPTRAAILEWIAANPGEAALRDLARAFDIRGADRAELRRLLRELEAEGHLAGRPRSPRARTSLPPVGVVEITGIDADGDLVARPLDWPGEGAQPVIHLAATTGARADDGAVGPGDRVLAHLRRLPGTDLIEGRIIRRIGTGPRRSLGIFRKGSQGARIVPVDKGAPSEWMVPPGFEGGAREGELVEVEEAGPRRQFGLPRGRVVARLGDAMAPRAVSLIAIHEHGIPDRFSDAALAEADAALPAADGEREDLRPIPLVTIDPEDARDRDDAVAALPDDDPANPGGHLIWVAIADVAHHVRPGSALDREARQRGNSTYFPDRVVPMLPDRLSGDLCSLHEGVDRACIAVCLKIAEDGRLLSHRFTRGIMRSRGSLEYGAVQAALDGSPAPREAALLDPVLRPLKAAYDALARAREARQPLDLDLPERRIVLDDAGKVISVAFRERLETHRMIEECMVLANVAAAETLVARRRPLVFRVHEEPDPERIEALREVAQASGLVLAKGQVLRTQHLNRLLRQAEGTDQDELINMATLRAMAQAYYSVQNLGHFGLALRHYAHFTSPIRRYADLVVHRALILAHGWGPDPRRDGLSPEDIDRLEETAQAISDCERRSLQAERDTTDRYLAAYLADRAGAEFGGRISGVQKFGLFVKLDDSGADALVPVRSLGDEYFRYDAAEQSLTGAKSGLALRIGARVTVKLDEISPASGGILAELLTHEGGAVARPGGAVRGRPSRAREARGKAAERALKRREKRSRR